MNNNIIQYKGYYAKIEYNAEDQILFGKIEGIDDLVTFEANSASEIKTEFQQAVDDYLEFCEEVGKEPAKAYKGTFNVRVSPDLHKQIAMYGIRNGMNLNQTVERALRDLITQKEKESPCANCRLKEFMPTNAQKQINAIWDSAYLKSTPKYPSTIGRVQ